MASRPPLQGPSLRPLPIPEASARAQLTCGQLLFFSDLLQSAQESVDVGFDLCQLSFDCLQLAALHWGGRKGKRAFSARQSARGAGLTPLPAHVTSLHRLDNQLESPC